MGIRSLAVAVVFSAVWFGFASSSFAQEKQPNPAPSCPSDFQGHWYCHDSGMPKDNPDETTFYYTITSIYSFNEKTISFFDVVYDYDGPGLAKRWPAKCDAAGVLTNPDGRTFTFDTKKEKDDYIHIFKQEKYGTLDQECTRVKPDSSVEIPWP